MGRRHKKDMRNILETEGTRSLKLDELKGKEEKKKKKKKKI